MEIKTQKIGAYSIAGLMVSILSLSLVLLERMNFSNFIFIVVSSTIIIFIIGIQVENKEIREELENQELEQKKLGEKLKIHEQLIDMKAEIKDLQRKTSNGKKK